MDSNELKALVLRAQQLDQSAFGELYDLFAAKIYRFISYKLPTREMAEDVLQETFMKAWQALPKLNPEKLYFSAWLYTIARNLINDQYRAVKRRPTPDSLDNYYDLATDDDPAENTDEILNKEKLRKILSELPAGYKQVLELRFLQEFSVEETAKVMGKTVVAVRVMQHRAIKKLGQDFSISE